MAFKPNYAIKPTPEQALRSSRPILPARLIAALACMNRPSKSDRKAILSAWKEGERAKARSEFPLADHLLVEFFYKMEGRMGNSCCRHSTVIAEAVAVEMGLSPDERDRLLDWCEDNGGFCDCEIVLNTAGHWLENRGAAS